MIEFQTNTRERIIHRAVAEQNLPAHAQVNDDRVSGLTARLFNRNPHELATALGCTKNPAAEPADEVLSGAGVASERTRVIDVYRGNSCPGYRGLESRADYLDFGKLRHGR